MDKSDKNKIIERIKKEQGILKEKLIDEYSYLGIENLSTFINTSKKITQKQTKDGIRLYTKKKGCLGCLLPILLILLIGSCVASFSDNDKEKEEETKQTEQQEDREETEKTEQQEEAEQPSDKEEATKEIEQKAVPAPAPSPKEEEKEDDSKVITKECTAPTIKGNISSSGEKIYHIPSGAFYDRTDAEEMFCTEAEAQSAGYRKSER